MADEKKKKKKSDIRVDSGGTVEEVVSEHSSMKKEKKKKKKKREIKDDFAGEDGEIAERESEQLGEDALVKKKKSKKQRIDSEAEDAVKKKKSKKKNKEAKADPEAEDGVKKSKKKIKETKVDSNAEDGVKKKKKKSKRESGSDVIRNSESSKVCEKALVHTDDANKEKGKRKREDTDLGAEENTDNEMKRKSKKKKPSVDSEVEETSLNSTNDAKKKSKEEKTSEDSEVKENNKDSTKDSKKEKKKEKKQSVDSEVEDNNLNSTKDVKKKTKEKRLSEDSEVEENNKDSTKDAKTKQNVDSEAEENGLNSSKDAKKKRKKKKQSEVSEAEENNNDGKDAKKKRKKKQESGKSDKGVTTPSSKSTKRVKFSDQVEIFPAEDEETEEEDDEEVKVVRGKRFTKEEDELVKNAVLEYIDNHALGDEGIKMVMECKSHPQLKGCWKEIASALPWRAYESVYYRAHTIFEAGSKGVWTKEDLELVIEFQKKHGNDWRTLADAMGKHRKHVKDAWRRIRLASKNKGHWTREEYQSLFDLVNKDLRMKAFQEKHAKHGMLRDNIPWMAISDVLGTRDHVTCCTKWYEQLTSPMVAKGTWANVDDYRLLEELLKLDAACIDDVDWDYLLENRDGEACRKRWNQMVLHIGVPKSKTFAEQVEILSDRYRPDIAEDREDFDNRPYDPED